MKMRRFLALLLVGLLVCPTGAFAARGRDMASNVLVASGSVTQANMRISAVDGTSFVDFSAASVLTDYIGHLLVVKDSSGRMIQGYIKAAGTGETLGSELVTNGDMETGDPPTGWTAGSGATLSSVVDERTGGAGTKSCNIVRGSVTNGILRNITFTVGNLYYFSGWVKNVDLSTGVRIHIDFGPSPTSYTTSTSWVNQTFYRNASSSSININGYVSGTSGQQGRFDDISIKQVLTPSATGVTIVSTKGGSTFNWTNKNTSFNYNDSSNYTYQIFKTQAAPVVASGSVTQANTRLDLTTDNAFAWLSGVDLSAYTDGNYMLCLYNATGGYGACGWISSTPAAGETLDAELITEWVNWNPLYDTLTYSGSNITSAITSSGAYVRTNELDTDGGALFKYVVSTTVNSGQTPGLRFNYWSQVRTVLGDGAPRYITGYKDGTFGVIAYNYNSSASNYSSNHSAKRVTDPPSAASGGVRIVSTKGGATRNWLSKSASFNANDSAGCSYKIMFCP